MLKEYQSKTNLGVGVGFLMQLVGRFFLIPRGELVSTVGYAVAMAGLVLFAWGCSCYMKGKGYNPALGLLGLLSLIGLIVLVCFPDKHKGGAQPPGESGPPPLPPAGHGPSA